MLKYCISEANEEIIKFLLFGEKDDRCKLYINQKKFIRMTMHEKPTYKILKIKPESVIDFLEFIIEHNLYCTKGFGHECCLPRHFSSYLKHITKNNILEHIHFIVEILIPSLNNNKISLFENNNHNNYENFVNLIVYHSTTETLKFILEITPESEINFNNVLLNSLHYYGNFDGFDVILDFYFNKFIESLNKGFIGPILPLRSLLTAIIITQTPNKNFNTVSKLYIYNKTIDKMSDILNDLSESKKSKKFKNINSELFKLMKYTPKMKENLLLTCLVYNCDIAEHLIKDGVKTNIITKIYKDEIICHNLTTSLEILLRYNVLDIDTINKYFKDLKNSGENNCDIVRLLVEYGADYDTYGPDVLKQAKNYKNQEVIEYLEDLLNQD
ncbi:hypothetical protein QLL95_gp0566 [Cotonvirus japonicus]|uniref:Ankyrin repeat protein n=1 Tax=Cotonvirus japonicus TaxID=2811091 RepID=A0ABM7NU13_9VIRU|nr:hypothetical protein QLL95_gp0566 [Cotonvirus japonicus]BCS83557.1 hypothetical protein [Cotonvirus japonicus]